VWWAIGCLCSLSCRQSRATDSRGLAGLIRSTWDRWSSNSETDTVTVPLGILALAMSAKIRYCQVTILTRYTKWKAVQPIGINWRLLDSASRGMCASMPGHVEQRRPFHIHVKLFHDSPRPLLPPLELHHTLCSNSVLLETQTSLQVCSMNFHMSLMTRNQIRQLSMISISSPDLDHRVLWSVGPSDTMTWVHKSSLSNLNKSVNS